MRRPIGQPGGGRRRAVVLGLLVVCFGASACSKSGGKSELQRQVEARKQKERRARERVEREFRRKLAAAKQRYESGAALEQAVRRIAPQCKLVPGIVSPCEAQVDRGPLKRARKNTPHQVQVRVLCRLAGDPSAPVRGLAMTQLEALAADPQIAALPSRRKWLLPCYAQRLDGAVRGVEARYWAAALVELAAEQGVLDRYLPRVAARKEDSVRALGYKWIWLRAEPRVAAAHVKRLLAKETPPVRRAILDSFRRITKAGRLEACPLLRELLQDGDVEVAGRAAEHLVANCLAARPVVVTAAERWLAKRRFSAAHARAVIVAARNYKGMSGVHPDLWKPPPPALVKRAVRLLARVVALQSAGAAARSQALSGVKRFDPPRGRRLEKRYGGSFGQGRASGG